jgi:hypothetical protein
VRARARAWRDRAIPVPAADDVAGLRHTLLSEQLSAIGFMLVALVMDFIDHRAPFVWLEVAVAVWCLGDALHTQLVLLRAPRVVADDDVPPAAEEGETR